MFDAANEAHRRIELEGVLENVLGSMLGSMEAHLKKPEKRKRPNPAGYAKILLDDLAARGWALKALPPQQDAKDGATNDPA
jgi:hypothetical protein